MKQQGGRKAVTIPSLGLAYDSEDTARAALMDAEFVALDGLDEEDALERGFSLAELAPPQAEHDDQLRGQMIRTLGARA